MLERPVALDLPGDPATLLTSSPSQHAAPKPAERQQVPGPSRAQTPVEISGPTTPQGHGVAELTGPTDTGKVSQVAPKALARAGRGSV